MNCGLLSPPHPLPEFPQFLFKNDQLNQIWDSKIISSRTKLTNSIAIFYKDKNPLNKTQSWLLITEAMSYYNNLNTMYTFLSTRRNTMTLRKLTIFEWKFFYNKSLSNVTGWKNWKNYKFETILSEMILALIIQCFGYYNMSLCSEVNTNEQLKHTIDALKVAKLQWLPHLKEWTIRNEYELPFELTLPGCLFYIDMFETRFFQIAISMTAANCIEEVTKTHDTSLEKMKRYASTYAKILIKGNSVLRSLQGRRMDNKYSNLLAEPYKFQEYLSKELVKYKATFNLLVSFQAAINTQALSASILGEAIIALEENKLEHPLFSTIRTWYKSRSSNAASAFENDMAIDPIAYVKFMEINLSILFDDMEKYEQDFKPIVKIEESMVNLLLQISE